MTDPKPTDPAVLLCRTLVVDDDDEMRALIKATVESAGYPAVAVSGGQEAVRRASKEKFDLAILDMNMPGMNGLETIDALKAVDPGLEFILVTGNGSEAVAADAVRRGAFAYLVKPFDAMELRALLPGVREKLGLKSVVGLYETTRSVYANVQLKDLLPHLMPLAKKILGADDVSLMLLGDDGALGIVASSGLDTNLLSKVRIRLGEGVSGRVGQWRTGVTINGPLQSDPRFADLPSRADIRFSLVYPIVLNDELVGVLSANRKSDKEHFLAHDLRHAALFCAQIAQAIENAKLYEKLEAARRQALDANALKDELLHMVVHDLKSPLGAIRGYAEVLELEGADEALRKEAVGRIFKSAENMLFLVNQILRKGQLESAAFALERKPFRAGERVPEWVEELSILARKKNLSLGVEGRLPPGYEVNADESAVREILSNLVGNAVKFCRAGEAIRVVLGRSDGRFLLSVADTGPGIAPEDRRRVFEKFQRGKGATGVEGSGYGLAIVKRLTELHGGAVNVESSPKGTTFTVSLPER